MIKFGNDVVTFGGSWLKFGYLPTVYHVTVSPVQHGTVAVNPTEGPTGTLVTISTVPDTGYELDTILLTGAELINGNQFYIDGSDVTVNVTFREVSAVEVLYVNRMNDVRAKSSQSIGDTHYLYPYMTSFENQSQTPDCGSTFKSVSTVTPNGTMPNSYAGMPMAVFVSGGGASDCSQLLETASLSEFTWGIWAKTPTVRTIGYVANPVYGLIGVNSSGTNPDWVVDLYLMDSYNTSWGNATVEKFNGSSGDAFDDGPHGYQFGFHPERGSWNYYAVYFNRTTHTVEYYINGNIYFRLTNVPDETFTNTSLDYNATPYPRNISHINSTPDAVDQSFPLCEYVIYRGKHTAIPTAPYIATQYNINVAATQHGTVSVNPSSGSTGMLVTITVTPESGYELDSISLTGATLINANQFYIENTDVTVTATFVQSVNFRTVNINGLTWSAEDLNVNDGLGNDDIKEESYTFDGTTYSWCLYTITAAQRIAARYPGWHIATADEWVNLATYAGGWDVAGGKMKTTFGWKNSGNGTNELGFNGYPTGGWDTAIHHQATGITESAHYIAIPVSGGSQATYVGLSYLNNKLSNSVNSRPTYNCLRLVKDHN